MKSGLKAKSIVYAVSGHKKRKLDLYLPKNPMDLAPLIIYFHGGGWMTGSKKTIEPGILKQVERGYAVASVNYSFIPFQKFPTQAHEIKAAVRYLRANASQYHINPELFFTAGVSAGGHLANILGCSSGSGALEGDLGNHHVSSDVQGAITWYGLSDLSQMGNNDFFDTLTNIASSLLVGANVKASCTKTQMANPIQYITSKTPPFFIFHGENDTIVNINQSELLYAALQQHKINVTYTPVSGFYHSDLRFNEPKYIQSMEYFLDKIASK